MEAKAEGKQLKSMITEFFRAFLAPINPFSTSKPPHFVTLLWGPEAVLGSWEVSFSLFPLVLLVYFCHTIRIQSGLVVVLYSEILDMGGGERKLQFKCWDSARSESRKTYGNGWFTLLAASLSCTGSLEWAWGSGGRGEETGCSQADWKTLCRHVDLFPY